MKRFINALALVIVLAAAQPALAQSANKIIDRYKKASGGQALKKIKNTYVTGALKRSDGLSGSFIQQTHMPDRLRTDIAAGDARASECYNGKSAWRMDGRGLRTLIGGEAKRLRLDALLANYRLQELSKNRIFPQTPLKTRVEGREAFAIEFVREEARVKLFFDAGTGLVLKQERETTEGAEEIFYSDYRAVDKVMEPFAIRIKNGGQEIVIAVEKVEHNRAADETAFRYPQTQGDKPMPEVEALMKAVVANQEAIEELREKYTFRQTETENKVDGSGRVKESEVRVSEVTPIAGRYVERLVSVNNKPLSAKEQEDEDKRVQKEIEEILKKREKREQERLEKERDKMKNEDSREERGNFTILGILRLSEVTSVRREMFRGFEVIAFDFEPKKGVKPKSRIESIINKLAGTMWIDEAAKQIVRLEARFTDSFKVGGGLLASVAPSTAVALEQQKVGDEVWMPSYSEANISARIFLLAKFNRNVLTRYSDYKKYSIDNKYELEKPKDGKPDDKRGKDN
jgi:hypothetical protein